MAFQQSELSSSLSTPIPSISLTKAIKKVQPCPHSPAYSLPAYGGKSPIYSTGMLVILPSSRLGVSRGKMEENAFVG